MCKNVINGILNDSKRLEMLCKGYYLLNSELNNMETVSLLSSNNGGNKYENKDLLNRLDDINVENEEYIIDIKQNMYALLPKPILFDLAWNFIEYQGFEKKNISNVNNLNNNNPNKKEDTKKEVPKKQTSWLGGLFG